MKRRKFTCETRNLHSTYETKSKKKVLRGNSIFYVAPLKVCIKATTCSLDSLETRYSKMIFEDLPWCVAVAFLGVHLRAHHHGRRKQPHSNISFFCSLAPLSKLQIFLACFSIGHCTITIFAIITIIIT